MRYNYVNNILQNIELNDAQYIICLYLLFVIWFGCCCCCFFLQISILGVAPWLLMRIQCNKSQRLFHHCVQCKRFRCWIYINIIKRWACISTEQRLVRHRVCTVPSFSNIWLPMQIPIAINMTENWFHNATSIGIDISAKYLLLQKFPWNSKIILIMEMCRKLLFCQKNLNKTFSPDF